MGKDDLFDNEFEKDDLLDDDDFERDDDDVENDLKPDKGPDIDDIDEDEQLWGDDSDYELNMDDDKEDETDDDIKESLKEDEDDKADEEEKADVKLTEEDQELAKLYKDVLETVGEDTVLNVKGKKVKAGDLAPAEIKQYLQQGIRSNDVYHEAKRLREETLRDREKITNDRRYADTVAGRQSEESMYDSLPEALKPTDDDTPEVRTLKDVIAGLNNEVANIKESTEDTQVAQSQAQLERELSSLSKEYPMGSVDESIAVKYFRPEMDLSELMRETHNHYTSDKFIGAALDANPALMRQIKNDAVKEYLSKSKDRGRRTAPTKSFRGTSSDKVSSKTKSVAKNFDQADELARAHVLEMMRMGEDD